MKAGALYERAVERLYHKINMSQNGEQYYEMIRLKVNLIP
jgi:hypothetical protein